MKPHSLPRTPSRFSAWRKHQLSRYALAACAALTFMVVLVHGALAEAQTFTVLYNFCPVYPFCSDGENPYAGVFEDGFGNLYGTAGFGGSPFYGVVFRVTSSGTETVLHNFHRICGWG
jgi:uncharacterized repeat protein (TIGR03803 family)